MWRDTYLSRPRIYKPKIKLNGNKYKVLVKGKQNQIGHSQIAESPVDIQESLKKAKFSKRIVRSTHSLRSLFSHYPYTNMSFLDHTDIISPITDSKSDGTFERSSNKSNNQGFLERCHSGTNNSLASLSNC